MQEQDDDARTTARSTRSTDRSRRRAALATGTAAVVVLALLVGFAASATRDDRRRSVHLFGDSLVLQASGYWVDLMENAGWDAKQSSFAGTNTCDWFGQMRKFAAANPPEVVALSFGGNDLTACMHHADGSRLTAQEFRARFRRDTETAVGIFGKGTTIFLVDPPAMYDGDDRFGTAYRAVAAEHDNVHFVDGGRILTPGRDWRRTLPCLAGERCTGPVVNGVRSNVVRAPDRIHFCPVDIPFGARCPVYSPGAYRFALTISDAIRDGAS